MKKLRKKQKCCNSNIQDGLFSLYCSHVLKMPPDGGGKRGGSRVAGFLEEALGVLLLRIKCRLSAAEREEGL